MDYKATLIPKITTEIATNGEAKADAKPHCATSGLGAVDVEGYVVVVLIFSR